MGWHLQGGPTTVDVETNDSAFNLEEAPVGYLVTGETLIQLQNETIVIFFKYSVDTSIKIFLTPLQIQLRPLCLCKYTLSVSRDIIIIPELRLAFFKTQEPYSSPQHLLHTFSFTCLNIPPPRPPTS
jgi:hypothetical protein